MKRSPLHRRTELRRESPRRVRERKRRRWAIAEVRYRDGDRCSAVDVLEHKCRGPLDAHEIIPRSAWPGGHLIPSNIRLICRAAHEWVDLHPVAAHRIGLHGHAWERTE